MCERGLLLSEWPPGTPPEPFRFPLRNRILAALSEVLVVVESRERGGSLITAQAAIERSVDVMAVPGSVRNRAAAGTNQLLRDGAAPVTGADDVLVALGLDTRRAGSVRYDPRPLPRGVEADVLAACRDDPRTLDDVVVGAWICRSPTAAMALARLERAGWVRDVGWVVRTGGVMVCADVNEYPRPRCRTPDRLADDAAAAWRVEQFGALADLVVRAHRRGLRRGRAGLRRVGRALPGSRRRTASGARSCGATSPS